MASVEIPGRSVRFRKLQPEMLTTLSSQFEVFINIFILNYTKSFNLKFITCTWFVEFGL